MSVTARDRGTGHEASTRITLSSGLSEPEMQDILDRGVADRVATATPDEQDIVPLETDDDPFTPIEPDDAEDVPLETDLDEAVPLETDLGEQVPLETEAPRHAPVSSRPTAAPPDTLAEDASLTSHSTEVPLENITEHVSIEEPPPPAPAAAAPATQAAPATPAAPTRPPSEIETQVDFEAAPDGAGADVEIDLDSPIPELDIDAIDDDDAILEEITPEVTEEAPAAGDAEEPYSLFDEPMTDLAGDDPEKQG